LAFLISSISPRIHSGRNRDIDDILQRQPILEGQESTTTALNTSQDKDDTHSLHRPYPLQRSNKQRILVGWRVGALLSLLGATSVFIFNLVITLRVWKDPKYPIEGSIGTLFEGNCANARKLDAGIHFLVNFLSTLLLGASNYCMQVLNAPSRQELVRSHAQRYWLHIGVPGLRNLMHIGRDRAIIWILLFLSSVPLHLFFNSVAFINLQANDYIVIPTTEDWLNGGEYDTSGFIDVSTTLAHSITSTIDSYRPNLTEVISLSNNSTMEKYKNIEETADCFGIYNNQYLSNIGNVYLVQEKPTVWRDPDIWYAEVNGTTSVTWINRALTMKERNWGDTQVWERQQETDYSFPFLSSPGLYPSNGWQCASHQIKRCDVDNNLEVPRDRSKWEPYESPIKYCVVEQVEERCKLQFSFPIAILVIASNLIKAICMALMLLAYRNHVALVTLGDAVAHFLDQPDPETRGRCLHGKALMVAEWNWEVTHGAEKGGLGVEPERFVPKKIRWAMAPGTGMWLSTYVL
jgi:hypothetical protein